jgi:hypothetical protein
LNITFSDCLRHVSGTRLFRKVDLAASKLAEEEEGVDTKSEGGEGKEPGEDDRSGSTTACAARDGLGVLLEPGEDVVDVVTGLGVLVLVLVRGLNFFFALSGILVHLFTHLDDVILILSIITVVVIVVVVILVLFLASHAFCSDDALLGSSREGKILSVIVHGGVHAIVGLDGAELIIKHTKVDALSITGTVGPSEDFVVVVNVSVCILVLLGVTVVIVIVVLVLNGATLNVLLNLELFSAFVLNAIFHASVGIALVLTDFIVVGVVTVAVLANVFALPLLLFQLRTWEDRKLMSFSESA